MVNVYVHLDIDGVPTAVIDDDAFIASLWAELPDAAVSGGAGHTLGLTLSQFALTDCVAVRRQRARARGALAGVGWPNATVRVVGVVREDVRDDIAVVAGAVRWHIRRLTERRVRRREAASRAAKDV